MRFTDLGLAEPIARAAAAEGYTVPTPIQLKAIPEVLAGRDLLGCAQTGTGKTAAFAMPILHRLAAGHRTAGGSVRAIRALILCPTRELASQIAESFRAYGRNLPLKHTAIFGGVSQFHQVRALTSGVDILVATPGRLMDLMNQGHVKLGSVETLVLDEADRMLDMGFIDDIRRIVQRLPKKRQTLLFSATMPAEIRSLAESMLHHPSQVAVHPVASTVDRIEQTVYHVTKRDKPALLRHLLQNGGMERTLVFTRTKHGADKVVKSLAAAGIRATAIHGNKSQNARTRALEGFKDDKLGVLVATDIASRGIDVDGITHVVNFDIPNVPETYVHRIGRTARAGADGAAVSFCDHDERAFLRAIEQLIRRPIDVNSQRLEFAPEPYVPRTRHPHHVPNEHGDDRPRRGHPSHRGHPAAPQRGRAKENPSHVASHRHSHAGHHTDSRVGAMNGEATPRRPSGFFHRGRGKGRARG